MVALRMHCTHRWGISSVNTGRNEDYLGWNLTDWIHDLALIFIRIVQ